MNAVTYSRLILFKFSNSLFLSHKVSILVYFAGLYEFQTSWRKLTVQSRFLCNLGFLLLLAFLLFTAFKFLQFSSFFLQWDEFSLLRTCRVQNYWGGGRKGELEILERGGGRTGNFEKKWSGKKGKDLCYKRRFFSGFFKIFPKLSTQG